MFVKLLYNVLSLRFDLGGLGVICLPQDPRFAGSNVQDVKILITSPPVRTLIRGFRVRDFRLVKEPQA